MKLRFWGTRGSIATPGRDTIELGGNTSCIQVLLNDNQSLILNSGTGIIEYATKGIDLENEREFHILLTNFGWDVIQGFSFFTPIHIPGSQIHLYSPFTVPVMEENINRLFDGSFSPLRGMSNLPADIHFHCIESRETNIYNAKILFHPTNHCRTAYGYKIITPEHTVAFAVKHENKGDPSNEELIQFIKGSDILVHDGQYTAEEYERRIGWGHSSIEKAIENAVRAEVKVVFITSHDTYSSDDFLRVYLKRLKSKLSLDKVALPRVELAAENMLWDAFSILV